VSAMTSEFEFVELELEFEFALRLAPMGE
jgi:hypothetical protein